MLDHATMCGFADSEAPLRSRILAMTTPSRSVSIAAIIASTVLGVVLLVGALQIPVPALRIQVEIGEARRAVERAPVIPRPVDEPVRPVTELAVVQRQQDHHVISQPLFTPVSVRPMLINGDQVQGALAAAYPQDLRESGVGGTATIWLRIGTDGLVETVRVYESSGHELLDEAAAGVAHMMRFAPARNRDQNVAVWVRQPVTFVAPEQEQAATR
jgi:TonB family protein